MLVTLSEVLKPAQREHCAVGLFNTTEKVKEAVMCKMRVFGCEGKA